MITFIAALDNKRGIANEHGVPWQSKATTDVKRFRAQTLHNIVLMGYGTYIEFTKPLSKRRNYVATHSTKPLLKGFVAVHDARTFLMSAQEDVWVIGGAKLFESVLDLANVLDITQVHADFNCTKFFPEYEQAFKLIKSGKPFTENGITFHFETWKRKIS